MVGKSILQYDIIEELGRGGMGVVYKARDKKLDREVALKFLPSHVNPTDHDIARFTQEAKAAAALNHPNVCTIYDIKEHETLHFIVMEYVEGLTIRKKISGGPVALDGVLRYGLQIADALQEAHARGIVHRDIKADNIMVNAKDQVKVMDFGLAKLKGSLKLTKSSSTVGTLAYMAPEQIQGGEVDARSDIFSFGVVLFEMLTARTPFRGEHEAAMMYSILNEEAERLDKYLPDAPPELLHVMSRALEKDPADRYQSIQEMAIDLRRMKKESSRVSRPLMPSGMMPEPQGTRVSPTVSKPQPATSGETFPAAGDSNKTTTVTLNVPSMGKGSMMKWVSIAAVLIVAVIGYFLFFPGGDTDNGERIPVAVADFQNQTKEDDLSGLSGMLITSLEQSRRLSVLTRSRMFDVLKQMGKGEAGRIDESLGREICRRTNTGALVVASISRFDELYIIDMKILDPEKNEYLLTLKEEGEGKSSIPGMIDKLSERTRLGLKEKAADVQANKQSVAEMTTPSMEAYQAYFRGEEMIQQLRFDDAANEFRRAIAIDSTFAVAHYRLAYALGWNGDPGAEEAIAKAMRYIDGVPRRESYLIRGEDAILKHDAELGLSIYREFQSAYPEDKEANYLVGDYSFHQLDYPAAEASLKKVLSLDPTFARAYQHLSWTYQFSKRFRDMRELSRRYIDNVPSPAAWSALTESYLEEGHFDSALQVIRDAPADIQASVWIRQKSGIIHLNAHQFEMARSVFSDVVADPELGPNGVRAGLEELVNTATWQGKHREALRLQDRLVEYEATRKDSGQLALRLAYRAYLTQFLVGDTGSARTFYNRARDLERYGDIDYHIALSSYFRAIGEFEKSGEIARTELAVAFPLSITQNEALREYHSGNYGSAIRLFREQPILFHQDLYAMAECLGATGKTDSAQVVLESLAGFHGGGFDFQRERAQYEAKGLLLSGKLHEKSGNREGAIDSYTKFITLWKNADPDIPDLIEGKKRLAALRAAASN
jgi:serine/threonine protein kinase/tetratricopeptide (TPR) repeat protein